MKEPSRLSRREFLVTTYAAAALLPSGIRSAPVGEESEKIIDIHQHTNYHGRSDADLVKHQRAMGITRTVLLPAGSRFGLAAGCGRNDTVLALTRKYPREFVFFANELPDSPDARDEISRYIALGAIGIGEQKFPVRCDSPHLEKIAALAEEHDVPVLLHFQHEAYNLEFSKFHRILEKFPKVNFIGHAQTWWGNIDLHHRQEVMYPRGKVTPGGLTDRLLADHHNMYGDLSAGSGLNALERDEEHARWFLERHQDKLLYGSDCADKVGTGAECQGARTLAAVRRLLPDASARRKVFHDNAHRLLKL